MCTDARLVGGGVCRQGRAKGVSEVARKIRNSGCSGCKKEAPQDLIRTWGKWYPAQGGQRSEWRAGHRLCSEGGAWGGGHCLHPALLSAGCTALGNLSVLTAARWEMGNEGHMCLAQVSTSPPHPTVFWTHRRDQWGQSKGHTLREAWGLGVFGNHKEGRSDKRSGVGRGGQTMTHPPGSCRQAGPCAPRPVPARW